MRERTSNGHQLLFDGRTIWINGPETGFSLARFSHTGQDIHNNIEKQMKGKACYACKPGPMNLQDLEMFKAVMKDIFEVIIPERWVPSGLVGEEKKC